MTVNTDPIFSIILPTLNRPRGLQRAVESVQRQTLQDFELIVVDDGSHTDYAQRICEASGLPTRLLRNGRNLGAAGARNAGLDVARGRYVSFLDDDDEYGPDFLASSFSTLDATSDAVVMSWCGVRWVDDLAGERIEARTRIFPSQHADRISLFEDLMSIGTGCGVTIKADFFRRNDWFDTRLRTVEDADLFLRIIASGRIPAIVPGVHMTVHNHGGARLTDARLNELRIRECHLLLDRYAGVFAIYPSLQAQLRNQIKYLHKEIAMHTRCLDSAETLQPRTPLVPSMTEAIESIRKIGRDIAAPAAADVDREARFPQEAMDALRRQQLLSPGIPHLFGGRGASLQDLCAMTASLSEHCSSTGMIFAMHQVQVACLVQNATDSKLLRDFVVECEERQLLVASATSEIGTGGDISTSIAPLVVDGEDIVLRKRCPVVSYGAYADAVLATARQSEAAARGDQVFVLLRGPSMRLEPMSEWNAMGMRGTCSPGFWLAARASTKAVLPQASGTIISETILPLSHVLWACVWMGIATAAVERARMAYRISGKDLPDGQTLPFAASRMVEALSGLEQLRALIRDALFRLDATPSAAGRRAPGFIMAMNHLKLSGSRLVSAICLDCLAVCGMGGYANDSPTSISRLLRDACSAGLMISNERIVSTNAALAMLTRVDAFA